MGKIQSLLVALVVILSFHSTSVLAYKHPGNLKIAIDTTYPPMEFETADGKAQGFDVDVARELAKRLGTNAEFIVMGWDGILAGLQSGRYDVIISSMNITNDRKKQVNFVEYVKMGQVFVARKNSAPIKSENDLVGKVVAVQADTTSFEAVDNLKKKGIAIKDIKAFKGATDTFSALKAFQADVVVVDEPVGYYYVAKDPKSFAVTGVALNPEPVGVAIRKKDQQLKSAIEIALKSMQKDGSFDKISRNWFNTKLGQKFK